METVLENIPTGVISLDAAGAILRLNTSVSRMFGVASSESHSLEELVGADAARIVHYLMRRSLRMGVVSREIETVAAGRVLHLAVTVSSLGPRRANTGYVLVLDDLTEVLPAQKSAAWHEVARRIAHAINTPPTPIQLSAPRLLRFLDNAADALENSAYREILVATNADSDAETVVICVSDTGTGISPEDKDKLFLPQFSTKDRGTGLGLAIAARIVAEHGGSIHVEDNLPVGSRFLIELPVAELTPASLADHNGSDATR